MCRRYSSWSSSMLESNGSRFAGITPLRVSSGLILANPFPGLLMHGFDLGEVGKVDAGLDSKLTLAGPPFLLRLPHPFAEVLVLMPPFADVMLHSVDTRVNFTGYL